LSTKLICDYCLRPIEADWTTMTIEALAADGVRGRQPETFEFHGGCYNVLQALIVQLRGSAPPPPIDPTPVPPSPQPTRDADPPPPPPPVAIRRPPEQLSPQPGAPDAGTDPEARNAPEAAATAAGGAETAVEEPADPEVETDG